MTLNRRHFLLGAAASALAATSASKSFAAMTCEQGAMFGPDGQVCAQALARGGQAGGVSSDGYILPMHRDSDRGYSDPQSMMVRPAGVAQPQDVVFRGPQGAGSIVLDHVNQYLYLAQGNNTARRYPICVGRDGQRMPGTEHEVFMMRINPTWQSPDGNNAGNNMATPGPRNPLGVRGLFLRPRATSRYVGHLIHGTNDPQKFTLQDGQRTVSAGCIRMLNPDVADLYARVQPGARVYPVHDARVMAQYLGTGSQATLRL